jgi:hypothetical protein
LNGSALSFSVLKSQFSADAISLRTVPYFPVADCTRPSPPVELDLDDNRLHYTFSARVAEITTGSPSMWCGEPRVYMRKESVGNK